MLTFPWKYKNVEADRRVMERLGHFHRTRSHAFACPKMAYAPKKPRQTLLSTFFTLRESAFEDLSLHSFLKASD